jgi:hypothetical protein
MRKVIGTALVVLTAHLGFIGDADAQVFTPTFTSPRLLNEVGIYVSDGPGALAAEGLWRSGPLGLRVGFVDSRGGLLSVGAELRNPLPGAAAPLGLAFTAGAQGLIGDQSAVGLQAGLSAGYTFRGQGLAFTPYLHPRVGLVDGLGGTERLNFEVLADVGADVEFYNNLLVRLGLKLDDLGSSWGIGLGVRR